jgi:hypothetical protein
MYRVDTGRGDCKWRRLILAARCSHVNNVPDMRGSALSSMSRFVDGPTLGELRWDLQEASEGYPDAVNAVTEAFNFGKVYLAAGRAKCFQ